MAAVDTNALVRLVTRDDPDQYAKALAFVNCHKPVLVTPFSVLELVWVLMSRYGHSKAKVIQVLQALLEMQEFNLQATAILDGTILTWAGCRADFADCYILESVKAASGTPLGTFDRTLAKLEGCQHL